MAANGRINIPAEYLEYGRLEKEVKFIGMGEFIRLKSVEELEKTKMSRTDFLKKLKEKRQKKSED